MIKFIKSTVLKALNQSEYPPLKGAKQVQLHEVALAIEGNVQVLSFVIQVDGVVRKDSIALIDFLGFLCKEQMELQLKYERIISNNPKLAK